MTMTKTIIAGLAIAMTAAVLDLLGPQGAASGAGGNK